MKFQYILLLLFLTTCYSTDNEKDQVRSTASTILIFDQLKLNMPVKDYVYYRNLKKEKSDYNNTYIAYTLDEIPDKYQIYNDFHIENLDIVAFNDSISIIRFHLLPKPDIIAKKASYGTLVEKFNKMYGGNPMSNPESGIENYQWNMNGYEVKLFNLKDKFWISFSSNYLEEKKELLVKN